jgi:hypothetical protein
MRARMMLSTLGTAIAAMGGVQTFSQEQRVAVDGDAQAWTVAAIVAGIVDRTGTTGASADTFPAATDLLAALANMSQGDSFKFMARQNNAHAITLTAGTGIVTAGTVNVAASNVRTYLLTLLSGNNSAVTLAGDTTNASAVISGFTQTQLEGVSVGMGITGTGIPASSYVVAVNVPAGSITINANATATGADVALAIFPRFELRGLQTASL